MRMMSRRSERTPSISRCRTLVVEILSSTSVRRKYRGGSRRRIEWGMRMAQRANPWLKSTKSWRAARLPRVMAHPSALPSRHWTTTTFELLTFSHKAPICHLTGRQHGRSYAYKIAPRPPALASDAIHTCLSAFEREEIHPAPSMCISRVA